MIDKNSPRGSVEDRGPASSAPEVQSSFFSTLRSLGADLSSGHVRLDQGQEKSAGDPPETEERKYVLEGELGQGGMGTVYRVRDQELNRSLAMKVIRVPGADPASAVLNENLLSRFLEEAQVTGQLDHPGIVPLHELGVDPKGRIYFTMRLVKGMHLGRLFDAIQSEDGGEEGWTIDRALVVMIKVCEALSYAHSKGVIHRDLKPENIMAGRFGEAYVMDWGLAKVRGRPDIVKTRDDEAQLSQSIVKTNRSGEESGSEYDTQYGSAIGTPSFMAPEQARGEWETVDELSDIYSLGAVLYQMLTGTAPYLPDKARVAPHTILRWVLDGPPQRIRKLAPSAPKDLVAIAEKAMSRERDERYASAVELGADLRRYLRGKPVRALEIGRLSLAARWCRRNPVVAGLLLAVSLGGGFGLRSLSNLSGQLVRASALDSVAMKADILEAVNSLYSSEIVARVDREHVSVTHDYQDFEGAIPLPATFLTSLGERISSLESGVGVRHYSDLPFKFRKDGGPRDEFERLAMTTLRETPGEPVIEFTEIAGKPVVRYATARVLKESCIDCHNTHPDSAKRDWVVGDVRGVLEIIRPLEKDDARTRLGLRGTFLTISGIVAGLMLLAIGVLIHRVRGESKWL